MTLRRLTPAAHRCTRRLYRTDRGMVPLVSVRALATVRDRAHNHAPVRVAYPPGCGGSYLDSLAGGPLVLR